MIYRRYCKTNAVAVGTALLIPPVDDQGYWVGCLFTSRGVGKKKDGEESILRATGEAVRGLLGVIRGLDGMAEGLWEGVDEDNMKVGRIGEVRMCKINSGKFGVPWEKTLEVLQGIELEEGWRTNVQVWQEEEG